MDPQTASTLRVPARNLGRHALAAWGAGVAVVIAFKLFVAGTSAWRFGRHLVLRDLACSLGGDALIAVTLLLAIVGSHAVASAPRAATPARWIARGALVVALLVTVVLQLVYPLCGYVFWEWGAFLEPLHVEAARRAGVSADLVDYALDARMAATLLAFAAAVAFSFFLARRPQESRIVRRIAATSGGVLGGFALGAFGPWSQPGAYDPSTPSPILLFARGLDACAGGLDPLRWPEPAAAAASFELPPARPVPPEWSALRGAASSMDVVIVVLESTRRDRLSIFGCDRPTTPNLARAAGHALLLDEAYVSQPRSCKTMESLLLGTYPDPRLVSIAWSGDAEIVRDSLLRRLAASGRRLYFGTSFAEETDAFDRFVELAAGRPLDRSIGARDLGAAAQPDARRIDDRALVRDFLAWRAPLEPACGAILWFGAAHHPYRALETPFGTESLLDRYDDCVWCADRALGLLIDGLEAAGRADRTLLVVLGDHGEALGEHLDVLHGSWFFDHSIRIPCLMWNPRLFEQGRRCDARFCVKDLPGTLLWMLGDEAPLGQSHVLFGNRREDPIYLSNVFQDYKLGRLRGDEKLTFRPERDELWVHDLGLDPGEERPRPARGGAADDAARSELVAFYWAQLRALGTADRATRARLLPPVALELTVEPRAPRPGEMLKVRVRGGSPHALVRVQVVSNGGRPADQLVQSDELDEHGALEFDVAVPAAGAGGIGLQACQFEPGRQNSRSSVVEVTVR